MQHTQDGRRNVHIQQIAEYAPTNSPPTMHSQRPSNMPLPISAHSQIGTEPNPSLFSGRIGVIIVTSVCFAFPFLLPLVMKISHQDLDKKPSLCFSPIEICKFVTSDDLLIFMHNVVQLYLRYLTHNSECEVKENFVVDGIIRRRHGKGTQE
ncbi:unnamed protein product [Hymenolepis diminuta]|uniref:Uncharacterized protein n=1 Tax=Hymenolepis diminuta TaxID=6216 RepID=A0A564XV43_HYMDI|nr:unnamed protein product [Hymenolepis diminuta]